MSIDSLIEPIGIAYEGLFADDHVVDALQLGQSIAGTAKLYNNVTNVLFHGFGTASNKNYVRVYAGPPQIGSLSYSLYLLMSHGILPLYPEVLKEFAKLAVPPLIQAIFAKRSGRSEGLERAIDTIQQMVARQDDFARMVHKDHLSEKAGMLRLIEKLAEQNAPALREMSAPVGRSTRKIVHFPNTSNSTIVDEPLALAFRSKDNIIVGDQTVYTGRIVAIDKKSGTCKILIEGNEKPIAGKITDPILRDPGNTYTQALHLHRSISLIAKPIFKDGRILRLFVSDARLDLG